MHAYARAPLDSTRSPLQGPTPPASCPSRQSRRAWNLHTWAHVLPLEARGRAVARDPTAPPHAPDWSSRTVNAVTEEPSCARNLARSAAWRWGGGSATRGGSAAGCSATAPAATSGCCCCAAPTDAAPAHLGRWCSLRGCVILAGCAKLRGQAWAAIEPRIENGWRMGPRCCVLGRKICWAPLLCACRCPTREMGASPVALSCGSPETKCY